MWDCVTVLFLYFDGTEMLCNLCGIFVPGLEENYVFLCTRTTHLCHLLFHCLTVTYLIHFLISSVFLLIIIPLRPLSWCSFHFIHCLQSFCESIFPHVFQFTFSFLNVSRLPVEPTGSETCSWLCPSSWHLKSSYMFKAARPTYLVPPTLSIISPLWNRVLLHAVKWIQEKAQLYEDDSFVFLCSRWKMGINVVWSLSAVKALSRCLDG